MRLADLCRGWEGKGCSSLSLESLHEQLVQLQFLHIVTLHVPWVRCCTFRAVQHSDGALERFCGMAVYVAHLWGSCILWFWKLAFCYAGLASVVLLCKTRLSNLKDVSCWQMNVLFLCDAVEWSCTVDECGLVSLLWLGLMSLLST